MAQTRSFALFCVLVSLSGSFANAFQPKTVPFSWEQVESDFLVRNFTTEDGLPVNSINSIVPHPNGYMYITTFDGLVQFDGNRFVSYTTSNTSGLKSNRLTFALLDGDKNLWMNDLQGNLYMFNNGFVECFQDHLTEENVIVYKFLPDQNGTIWASSSAGLYRQTAGIDFEHIPGTENIGEILDLETNQQDGVSILADKGIFSYSDDSLSTLLTRDELPVVPEQIFKMKNLSMGRLWLFGRSQDLYYVTPDKNLRQVDYPADHDFMVFDLSEENDSTLLGATSNGYYRVDSQTLKFHPTKLMADDLDFYLVPDLFTPDQKRIQILSNRLFIEEKEVLRLDQHVTGYATDVDGSIWLGTSFGGLYQITKKKMFTIGPEIDPSIRLVYSIIEDTEQNMWMAGLDLDLGISRINSDFFTTWSYDTNTLQFDRFNALYQSKNGTIYAGAENALYTFRNGKWISVPADLNNITAVHEELTDRLWIGNPVDAYYLTDSDLVSFESKFGIRLGSVKNIIELNDGTLAFLTSGSGVVFLDKAESLRFLNKSDGLSSDQIRDLFEASPDTLWVVSEDLGLNRVILDATNNISDVRYITAKDGLIDNSLHRLINDPYGFFWLNSNKGIMRINEKELNDYLDGISRTLAVESFTKEDGLDNIEGNGGVQNAGVLTSDGKLLFPNQGGVIYTRPEWHLASGSSKLSIPKVEQISFADTSISLQGKTTFNLPRSVRDFQIRFTLPEFLSPDRLQLEYKLEGVNQDWHRVSSDRMAVFTNTRGGTMNFLMRGKLVGDPEYSEGSFSLSIPLVYYETVWFKLASVLALGLMLFTSGWVSIRRSKKREAQLEALVQDRTKALTDRTRELEQSREEVQLSLQKIQKLDESKSRFFTNFTHELRTPLSLILNPLEDMLAEREGIKSKDSARQLVLMKRNAERLKGLINQLLDVSKLNSGEISLELEPLNLFDLTRHISSQFEHILNRKNIRFSITKELTDELLYMDRKAWEHICTNLISNAVKFTPGHGAISIHFSESSGEQIISIKDSGIGIQPRDIPYIFDSYFQGDSSISKAEGTGIGLSLVKGLITRMNGTIEVFSEEGKGAEFVIRLKKGFSHINKKDTVSHEVATTPEYPVHVHVPEPNQGIPDENKIDPQLASILLVEDNEDFREYIYSVISEFYNVRVATNGAEGLKALNDFRPDIILSDIMMPEMDGFEMMRAIRSRETYKHIPFIFLSAKDSEVDIETGLNSGADIYLTKPVQNKLLLTQIRVLLRREKNLRQSVSDSEKKVLSPFLSNVIETIQRHLGNPDLNIDLIADALSMSKATLYRKWKAESEETLNQKITHLRLEEALRLIRGEGLNFSEAAYAVGYNNLSYFSQAFKKNYGVAPQEYLKEEA